MCPGSAHAKKGCRISNPSDVYSCMRNWEKRCKCFDCGCFRYKTLVFCSGI